MALLLLVILPWCLPVQLESKWPQGDWTLLWWRASELGLGHGCTRIPNTVRLQNPAPTCVCYSVNHMKLSVLDHFWCIKVAVLCGSTTKYCFTHANLKNLFIKKYTCKYTFTEMIVDFFSSAFPQGIHNSSWKDVEGPDLTRNPCRLVCFSRRFKQL